MRRRSTGLLTSNSERPEDSEEPLWIETESAIDLHDLAVARQGSAGFPNPGYFDSALNAARQTYHYTDGGVDLFDLAAVYLYHIAKAHAFTDGNKRTGYLTAIVFLGLNGIDILLPSNALILAEATERAAKNQVDKTELAAIMRRMPRRKAPTPPRPGRHRIGRRKKVPQIVGRRKSRKKKRGKKRLL
jgi:death on curing protein